MKLPPEIEDKIEAAWKNAMTYDKRRWIQQCMLDIIEIIVEDCAAMSGKAIRQRYGLDEKGSE